MKYKVVTCSSQYAWINIFKLQAYSINDFKTIISQDIYYLETVHFFKFQKTKGITVFTWSVTFYMVSKKSAISVGFFKNNIFAIFKNIFFFKDTWYHKILHEIFFFSISPVYKRKHGLMYDLIYLILKFHKHRKKGINWNTKKND